MSEQEKALIQRAYDVLTVIEVASAIERAGYEFGAIIEDGHLRGFVVNKEDGANG